MQNGSKKKQQPTYKICKIKRMVAKRSSRIYNRWTEKWDYLMTYKLQCTLLTASGMMRKWMAENWGIQRTCSQASRRWMKAQCGDYTKLRKTKQRKKENSDSVVKERKKSITAKEINSEGEYNITTKEGKQWQCSQRKEEKYYSERDK